MYLEARWVDGRQAVASLRIFRGALPGRRSRLERWLLYLVVFVALNCALLWVLSIDDNMIVSLPFRSGSWKQKSSGPARSRDPYTAMGSTRASLPPEAIFRASQAHEVEDGLLKVNMESKLHPVYQLIRDARTAWNNKLARQSQSLKEAVQEYRRRYGRHPPKGFDRWWRYVKANNVSLPDEYDQIERDLLPFRALSPQELGRRQDELSGRHPTYTLQVTNGSLHTLLSIEEGGASVSDFKYRVEDQVALIEPIVNYLEDFKAVYWLHDNPATAITYDHRQELLKTLRGRQSDHYRSMDICEHPEMVPLHGTLAGVNLQGGPLTPMFVLAKTRLHGDILGVPVEQVVDGMRHIPWEHKVQEKLIWRGRNTGSTYSKNTPWRATQRPRLVEVANAEHGELELLGPPAGMGGKTVAEDRTRIPRAMANRYYFDIAFVDEPIQCDVPDGTCQEIAEGYHFAEGISHDAALYYKYIIDVMQAWVHYVPIQLDYSDLYDAIAFFRGDLSGQGGESALAKEIADAGRAWSNANWRRADMTAYAFRLYLEWARLLAPQTDETDFVEKHARNEGDRAPSL
ncbi:Glycosyltransferase 90 protein [Saitozyma podzolica]|uniref:Glycosyltransferase 90 protein n=1 Tax=Saitozyma podzolica TaxID=1890683 RepID=A0A427YIE0_9TREE|nr:Glycosyltransferase 90 protein [Saitozyma podzolica]